MDTTIVEDMITKYKSMSLMAYTGYNTERTKDNSKAIRVFLYATSNKDGTRGRGLDK